MQLHSINIRHPSSMDEQTVINFLFFIVPIYIFYNSLLGPLLVTLFHIINAMLFVRSDSHCECYASFPFC